METLNDLAICLSWIFRGIFTFEKEVGLS